MQLWTSNKGCLETRAHFEYHDMHTIPQVYENTNTLHSLFQQKKEQNQAIFRQLINRPSMPICAKLPKSGKYEDAKAQNIKKSLRHER